MVVPGKIHGRVVTMTEMNRIKDFKGKSTTDNCIETEVVIEIRIKRMITIKNNVKLSNIVVWIGLEVTKEIDLGKTIIIIEIREEVPGNPSVMQKQSWV